MAKIKISCVFRFASSHFLTNYHGKCERLHGHNYKMIVTVKGEVKNDGMVLDFKILKEIVKENVINLLDHQHLNDIIKNPSAENITIFAWEKLKEKIPLKSIRLYETENYYCEYEGE